MVRVGGEGVGGEKVINLRSVRGLGCSMEVSNKGNIIDECVDFGH